MKQAVYVKAELVQQGIKVIKVVYDVDDVLWGLDDYVMEFLGLDINDNIEYRISKSPIFTAKERKAIIDCFCDAKMFENMEFYPGADKITDVEKYGATVRIHSNCYSDAIAEQKRRQLYALLPQMKRSFIKLLTVSPTADQKQVDQDAYIFVDDCPYNVALSMAKFNFVPRKPWNLTTKAKDTMTADGKQILEAETCDFVSLINSRHRYIIYAKDLQHINQAVIDIAKIKQRS